MIALEGRVKENKTNKNKMVHHILTENNGLHEDVVPDTEEGRLSYPGVIFELGVL